VPTALRELPEQTLTASDLLRRAAAAAGVNVAEMEARAASADVIPDDEHEANRQQTVSTRKAAASTACAKCEGAIKPRDPNMLVEVKGWARQRVQGGTNHVIARYETGRFLCGDCAIRMRAGLGTEQERML
jgi:hypothetical protein